MDVPPGARPRDYLILTFGVFACSLSVLFLKNSETHPIWLSGIRTLIAAMFLTPLVLIEARKDPGGLSLRQVLRSAPGGVLLAVHFITWTMGARLTSAANGSLIVNLTTVTMPIVMWLMVRERITRGEIIGSAIALSGVVIKVASELTLDPGGVRGDVICLVSMVLYCLYLAFSRRNGMGRNLWLYVVPLYYICGVVCCATALLTPGVPLPPITQHEATMLVCLGLIPTVLGHSIMNWCIRHMRGQVVSTFNLFQFASAGVIAYFLSGELPKWTFIPMCVLIVIGSIVVIRFHRPKPADVDAES
jgi:drug/metabolite transporter (DMT)-like permease